MYYKNISERFKVSHECMELIKKKDLSLNATLFGVTPHVEMRVFS